MRLMTLVRVKYQTNSIKCSDSVLGLKYKDETPK